MISNAEWEIISLYKVFSLKKTIKVKKVIARIPPQNKEIREKEITIVS